MTRASATWRPSPEPATTAVDRGEPGGVTFTCRGYRWLKANAGEYGFIGLDTGAWHWDWVGDGGQMHGAPIRPDVWFWFQTH